MYVCGRLRVAFGPGEERNGASQTDGCITGQHFGTVLCPCGSPAAYSEIGGEWRCCGTLLNTAEPLQVELRAAIQGSRVALEGKIETVAVEVNLLRAELQKVSNKLKVSEGSIAELQSEVGTLRKQMLQATSAVERLEAQLEDAKGWSLCNNVRLLGFPGCAVLTVVFGASIDDDRTGAGRLSQEVFGVPVPWCPPSSWSVKSEKSLQKATEEEKRGNKGVCVNFSGRTRSLRRLVSTQGRLGGDFRHSVVDPLRVAGFSDTPGSVGGILGLLTSSSSFRWAVRGNFSLTAGTASISPLEVGQRCPRSAVRRSGGPCVEVPVAPQAPRCSFPCEVEQLRPGSACSEFFTAEQAVRHF
ncbi:hypothetical protein NDU88_010539 [Pleurodeles waltl]|uniref:Uncharacterized protein n=1 Tax=Pleurodeles waltl TaxID=8319 RepID=A0AAV7PYN5_PLEWA|nr:hypothetical protein NDU88_010539 [Pleurodeles waltl]